MIIEGFYNIFLILLKIRRCLEFVTTYLLRPLDGDWIKNLICKTRDRYIRDIAHLKLAGIQV